MLVECQRNAYLKRLTSQVVSCEQNQTFWEVILTDTILYPEGGGQPTDYGTINGVAVERVERRSSGQIVHVTNDPVQPGQALVEVDWERRYDHMQQHTAQHLITALVQDHMGFETLSFHLGKDRCDIVLDTDSLTETQLAMIEGLANEAIRNALSVSLRVVEVEDMLQLDVRTRGLPDGLEGAVRLVEIQGLDLNTCGGTHVESTAELQAVSLIGVERVSQGTRLFFLAGNRVLRSARKQLENERNLTELLSVGPEQHVTSVTKLIKDSGDQRKLNQRLLQTLADVTARELLASDNLVMSHHQSDADFSYLNRIVHLVRAARPDAVLLLTAGDTDDAGLMLLAGPPDFVSVVSEDISRILVAKGGGRPGMFQGKATALSRCQEAVTYLEAKLQALPQV